MVNWGTYGKLRHWYVKSFKAVCRFELNYVSPKLIFLRFKSIDLKISEPFMLYRTYQIKEYTEKCICGSDEIRHQFMMSHICD